MDRAYRVVLDPDPEEGGFTVTVPALPGVVTQGATVEQCIERIRAAIELHFAAMAEEGEPIEVELDKSHDEPTFGPLARATIGERFRLATEIVRKLGDPDAAGPQSTAGGPAADNHGEVEAPRS